MNNPWEAVVRGTGDTHAHSTRFLLGAVVFFTGFAILIFGAIQDDLLYFWGGIAIAILGFLSGYTYDPEDAFERRVEEFKEAEQDRKS